MFGIWRGSVPRKDLLASVEVLIEAGRLEIAGKLKEAESRSFSRCALTDVAASTMIWCLRWRWVAGGLGLERQGIGTSLWSI
jgi:hypothetical protein